MPVKQCQEDGRPGYKWGDEGKCYTYTEGNESSKKRAKAKAAKQGAAAQANKWAGNIIGLDLTDPRNDDTL